MLTLIRRTLRVPTSPGAAGDGRAEARRLDAALLQVGFKASKELIDHVAKLAQPGAYTKTVVDAVRGLVGDHVQHNPYFKDFPHGVPDTVEFWADCLHDAIAKNIPEADGFLNLLALPKYGRRQHTYEELLRAHDDLIPSIKGRFTVLHLGGTLEDETRRLYLELATSPTPLGEADRLILAELAEQVSEVPDDIPMRENRAIINAVRLSAGRAPEHVDTVTDVLRIACQASGGDVALVSPTRFRSFRRPERRVLLAALDRVIAENPAKLGDVRPRREVWKRLGERLHPHEFDQWPHAQDVFAVARGDKDVRSFAGRVELAFQRGVQEAVKTLTAAPGMLLRQTDRLLRNCAKTDVPVVVEAVRKAAPEVSGRVLVSLLEHLENRGETDLRVFANRSRFVWVTEDTRPQLDPEAVAAIIAVLEDELTRRLPAVSEVHVDEEARRIVLPLSGNNSEEGFAVLPRGSKVRLDGDLLRFFTYWRQAGRSTDYDLSAVLLDDELRYVDHVSWTNITGSGAYYSGDLTDAKEGATEFVDVPRDAVRARYVVPQVHIYAGEGFGEVAESMFGFMSRDLDQKGKPFEPSTVRARSAMRGPGRIAVPVVFERTEDGWEGTWLHLYLRGTNWGNTVEANEGIARLVTRGVLGRKYFTVERLAELLRRKSTEDGPKWNIALTDVDQLDNLLDTPASVNDARP